MLFGEAVVLDERRYIDVEIGTEFEEGCGLFQVKTIRWPKRRGQDEEDGRNRMTAIFANPLVPTLK